MTFAINLADPASRAETSFAATESTLESNSEALAYASLFHPGYVSGRWYGPLVTNIAATSAVTADTMFLLPIPILFPCSINAVCWVVGTLAAGSSKMGMYDKDYALLGQSPDEIDAGAMAANSVVTHTFSTSIAIAEPGIYHIAAVYNAATATPYTYSVASGAQAGGFAYMTGSASGAGVVRGGGSATSRLTVAQLFADPFPAQLSTPTLGTSTPPSPVMGFRIA